MNTPAKLSFMLLSVIIPADSRFNYPMMKLWFVTAVLSSVAALLAAAYYSDRDDSECSNSCSSKSDVSNPFTRLDEKLDEILEYLRVNDLYCNGGVGFKPTPKPAPGPFESCKEILEAKRADGNKAYELEIEGQKTQVYCHMTDLGDCGGGGWTMVMKMDGNKHTFTYDKALWSDKNTLNPQGGKTGFDSQETKLPTYWDTPFSKICVGMKVGSQIKFLKIDQKADSLHSLIADGQHRATSLGRDAWKTLIGSDASLQRNCNIEGFNAKGSSGRHSRARIGIAANEQNNCASCDSRIGLGTGGYPEDNVSCGDVVRHGGDNGDKTIKALGYILVQ